MGEAMHWVCWGVVSWGNGGMETRGCATRPGRESRAWGASLGPHAGALQGRRAMRLRVSLAPACCLVEISILLQHAATCCNMLQHSASCCIMLQHAAITCCYMLHHAATCCNMLQHAATCCIMLQHAATCCIMLQHAATCCNMLDHAASCCNMLQHHLLLRRNLCCAAAARPAEVGAALRGRGAVR